MYQLIAITEENGKKTVNARELHAFIGSKQEFANWIKGRIDKYNFIENQDFVTIDKIVNRSKFIEYHISLDMAKELSMVENNDKGQEARRYFIECERRALTRIPTEPREQALFLAQNLLEMQKQLEDQKPAVEFVKALQAIEDSLKIGDFAKILFDKNSLVIGQNRLFQWLKDKKYLQQNRTPFQKYMDMGLFETVMGAVTNSTTGRIWTQTKVTGKGIVYLTQKILESGDFAPYNTKLISNK